MEKGTAVFCAYHFHIYPAYSANARPQSLGHGLFYRKSPGQTGWQPSAVCLFLWCKHAIQKSLTMTDYALFESSNFNNIHAAG